VPEPARDRVLAESERAAGLPCTARVYPLPHEGAPATRLSGGANREADTARVTRVSRMTRGQFPVLAGRRADLGDAIDARPRAACPGMRFGTPASDARPRPRHGRHGLHRLAPE